MLGFEITGKRPVLVRPTETKDRVTRAVPNWLVLGASSVNTSKQDAVVVLSFQQAGVESVIRETVVALRFTFRFILSISLALLWQI